LPAHLGDKQSILGERGKAKDRNRQPDDAADMELAIVFATMEHGTRSADSADKSFLFQMAKEPADQRNRKRKIFRNLTQGIEGLRLRAAMGERILSKQLQKRAPFVSDFSAGESLRQKRERRRGAFRSHGRNAGTRNARHCSRTVSYCLRTVLLRKRAFVDQERS
jgi:hypothetical protein